MLKTIQELVGSGRVRQRGAEPLKPPLLCNWRRAQAFKKAWSDWLNWKLDWLNEQAVLAPIEAYARGERWVPSPPSRRGRGRPLLGLDRMDKVRQAALDAERIKFLLAEAGKGRRYYHTGGERPLAVEEIAATRWGVDEQAVIDHCKRGDAKRPELRFLAPEVKAFRCGAKRRGAG